MNKTNSESAYKRIEKLLGDLYGIEEGQKRFNFLRSRAEAYLNTLSDRQIWANRSFNSSSPYENLKHKIFVIAYPDNVYRDHEYPLVTLKRTLCDWFPSIKGIHILPERTMSHNDIWPQDFFRFCDSERALGVVEALQEEGILDDKRRVTERYQSLSPSQLEELLRKVSGQNLEIVKREVSRILESAWNSHFNDGGFSQKTRAEVDPRFGEAKHLESITESFSTMLDFVVNHLDIDNHYLEEFRRGNNDGEAFLIIYRDQYRQLKADGVLDKTFRPRPFPLFTGMRKYPLTDLEGQCFSPEECADEMNRIFRANGLDAIDTRIIRFMSIYFKIENDQGLTAEDSRIFSRFEQFAAEKGIDTAPFWNDSEIQARQKVINTSCIPDMEALMVNLGLDVRYADIFMNDSDHLFGREFYIYTTFSESQVDVNPLTMAGFEMIVEDLIHLLSSGSLSMMRMDAIKYLWKEIGARNFDMDEGNKLIEVIRTLLTILSPSTLPLDEINSPDPVVYSMAAEGGFAYLFGQVNAVPTAFNEGTLEPLIRFNATKKEKSPKNFLPFVMLSTHDGRSVQGLGVQRTDGHVFIDQFYSLKDTVESRGGKPKFRSVAKGEIPGDTFRKVFTEAGFEEKMDRLAGLFDRNVMEAEDLYRLKDGPMEEADLIEEIAGLLETDERRLAGSPAIDFFVQWVVYGRTPYELCCTTRSSFSRTDSLGNWLNEEEEARRLVLAQLFVLTQGQDVPAIYFNDLIALDNDSESYELSGRPRDLNRHKNRYEEMVDLIENDPFTASYVKKLNKILELRAEDESFSPGEGSFDFAALSDTVFLNHPWNSDAHSSIVGNILNSEAAVELDSSRLKEWKGDTLTDQITGQVFRAENGVFHLKLEPFGYLWLK